MSMTSPRELPLHLSPSDRYLELYFAIISLVALSLLGVYRCIRSPKKLLRACGVSLKKVKRAVREIERKKFHLSGLLVPIIYFVLMEHLGWSHLDCCRLCWTITVVGCCSDTLRLHVPFVARHWPGKSILREHEHGQLTGGSYFSLGCTLSIGAHLRMILGRG